MDMTTLVDGVTLLRLQPGDRLAVRVPEAYIEPEDVAEMQRQLKEAWPEIVTVFFTGDVELTVVRSDPEPLIPGVDFRVDD